VTLVVSDASPLIALQQIDELKLLQGLFGEVIIPPAVAREVASLSLPPWAKTRSLQQPMAGEILHASLGAGESEAISLAQEIHANWLLLDERPGRRLAQALGLRVAGTLGLLNRAKEKGLLAAVRPRWLLHDTRARPAHPERRGRSRAVKPPRPRERPDFGFVILRKLQRAGEEYDSKGHVTRASDALGRETVYVYGTASIAHS
jgi:uncharacterized protein